MFCNNDKCICNFIKFRDELCFLIKCIYFQNSKLLVWIKCCSAMKQCQIQQCQCYEINAMNSFNSLTFGVMVKPGLHCKYITIVMNDKCTMVVSQPLVMSLITTVNRMSQFGASLTDNSRVIIYDRNMFIIQATRVMFLGVVLLDRLLTLPSTIRLGWMGLSRTKYQAYLAHSSDTKKVLNHF